MSSEETRSENFERLREIAESGQAAEPRETPLNQNSEKTTQGVESKSHIRISKAPRPLTPVRGGWVVRASRPKAKTGEKHEQFVMRARLVDGIRDTTRWASIADSDEESLYVLGMQEQLTSLVRMVEHRIENRITPEEEAQWDTHVRAFLTEFQRASERRGSPVGNNLIRLAAYFTDQTEQPRDAAFDALMERGWNAIAASRRATAQQTSRQLNYEPQASQPQNSETPQAETKPTSQEQKPLTTREEKLWEIIQRGLRGTAYCRDVDAARVSPPRKGIWTGGPRTYIAAYLSRDQRLVHWIQNEKSKIRRKAELLGLVKLASE